MSEPASRSGALGATDPGASPELRSAEPEAWATDGVDDWPQELEGDERSAWALPSWLQGPSAWDPKRPPWATVVAAIFLLTTVSQVLYAGMIPLLKPILPDPVPWFGFVVGALSLAASLGIYRGLEWGRWLGIALSIAWLARTLPIVDAAMRSPAIPGGVNPLLDVAIPVALNAAILLLLLTRWPRR